MLLRSQTDNRWRYHLLGSRGKPGTIGDFGCDLTCDSMIVTDAFSDMNYPPDKLDEVFVAAGVFQVEADGTADLMPGSDGELDAVWPERFQTTHYAGFRADLVRLAIPTPDTYVKFWITGYSPLWGINIATHFVLGWSADGGVIADPEGGVVRPISAYGGTANIHRTILVKKKTPPVVVVIPPVVPKPVTPPVVPPVPVFSVRAAGASLGAGLKYDEAVAVAHVFAAGHVGVIAEVLNEKSQVVETEFVAPLPAAIPPKPVPLPTPAPAHVQQADFWAVLQNVLIQLVAALTRRQTK